MKQAIAKTTPSVNGAGTDLVQVLGQCLNPRPFQLRYNHCSLVTKGAQHGVTAAGFEPEGIWYTGSGTQMKIRDPQDGQEYILEVRPIYPKG